ncbi:hypothetical protein H2199_001118 [Coniosporium tulheliwenetii]|uniref:Uncharacterized protein n=1 Tax=Coniosporium tulheliwenetii TaxID=3383036 RepID=A0ACC2ZL93_9PEZI|nr:hypothetical protein H2199_001118 [Cladosporium sp. JES 115]
MATVAIPPSGMALHGAPDASIATAEERFNKRQVMPIQMNQEVIDELLKSVRSGKPPQIFFGRTPTLRYAGKAHVLDTAPEKFRHELYYDNGEHGLEFDGLVNYSLVVKEADPATVGVDSAMEALNSTMATIAEEKEGRRQDLLKKAGFLSPHTQSRPGTPSRLAQASPSLGPAPTSAPAMPLIPSSEFAAVRHVLVHMLAAKPMKTQELVDAICAPKEKVSTVLERCASREEDGRWQLGNKAYKELDVWEFPYASQEERQAAIDRAVKAYDRLRIGTDDKIWQLLLPKEERGKGKCLSRLVLNPIPMSTTPANTAKQWGKKTAVKKPEVKKTEREVSKEKPQEKKASAVTESRTNTKAVTKEKKEEIQQRKLKQQELKGQIKKPNETDDDKTALKKPPSRPPANLQRSPQLLPRRPSAPSRRTNRPSAPHLPSTLHKVLSASASPSKPSVTNSDRALKRKANDLDNDVHTHDVLSKQRKLAGDAPSSAQKPSSAPTASGPLKRKAATAALDSDASKPSTPAKTRKLISGAERDARRAPSAPQQNRAPSPASDSSDSPPLQLSFRQTIELAQKFHNYHAKYVALYKQIAGREEPPTEKQREDVLTMHRRLEEMKREIVRASAGEMSWEVSWRVHGGSKLELDDGTNFEVVAMVCLPRLLGI